jgi:3-oxoacyl-[acyl-carrier protein] reductase
VVRYSFSEGGSSAYDLGMEASTHRPRAIVTGGSRGIGFAIARALLAAGGQVVITGRDQAQLQQARQALLGHGPADGDRVVTSVADVRDRGAVDRMVADAASRFGGLDVLVNNAGVGAFATVETLSDGQWSSVIDTNLTGAFHCARAAIPVLKRAGGGWIINIASLAGKNFHPESSVYSASKAGLIAFSECLMQEVRYDGIRVAAICPGSVATNFMRRSAGSDDWKMTGDDVADVVMGLLRHPSRSLPSLIEMRPAQPKRR